MEYVVYWALICGSPGNEVPGAKKIMIIIIIIIIIHRMMSKNQYSNIIRLEIKLLVYQLVICFAKLCSQGLSGDKSGL